MTAGKELAPGVVALAELWEVPPAHVAFAYAFAHPYVASVLFGASSPEQLCENVDAFATYQALDAGQVAAVQRLARANT